MDPKLDEKTLREITENCRNHPSIIKIKEIVKEKIIFDLPEATTEGVNKIIKSLNPNKAATVIDPHLAYIINKDLKENKFSENAKTALGRSIYNKDDSGKIKNYKPVF